MTSHMIFFIFISFSFSFYVNHNTLMRACQRCGEDLVPERDQRADRQGDARAGEHDHDLE